MPGIVSRTALIVPVPEAAAAVDEWRERTCDAKPSAGVPPHITLVFPFVPAVAVGQKLVAELAAIFAAEEPFGLELSRTARFPGVLYLVPEPAAALATLIETFAARFPDYPPYEGAHAEIVPHLTVAQGAEPTLAEAERAVIPQLPLRARAREALLLEETEPDGLRWRTHARFEFLGRDPSRDRVRSPR